MASEEEVSNTDPGRQRDMTLALPVSLDTAFYNIEKYTRSVLLSALGSSVAICY